MYITAGQGLALLRMGFGLYFLAQAWDKTARGWLTSGAPLQGLLFGNPAATPPTSGAVANATPFYADFLRSTVQPNPLLWGQLTTIGEWVVGLLLVVGLLTRFAALVGLFLNLQFMFMKGLPALGGSSDRLFILAMLAFLLASAGLVWGLDGLWRRQLSTNALTRWLAGISGREDPDVRTGRIPTRETARAL